MIASQLINPRLKPLTTSMSIEEAEHRFEEAQVFYLPIITDENEVLGVVSLDLVLTALTQNQNDISVLLKDLNITPVLPYTCHYFELLKFFGSSELDIIPIVDETSKYQGCVTVHNIIEQSATTLAVQYPGAIVVLEIESKDYSLAEIMRLIESNGAKVLGINVVEVIGSDKLHVHLKLNTGILKSIIASLERFNYNIYAHFMRQDFQDDTEDRYRHLLNYLDLE